MSGDPKPPDVRRDCIPRVGGCRRRAACPAPSQSSRAGSRVVPRICRSHCCGDAPGLCHSGVCCPGVQDSFRFDDSHAVDRRSYPGQQARPTAFNGPASANSRSRSRRSIATPRMRSSSSESRSGGHHRVPVSGRRGEGFHQTDCGDPGDTVQLRTKSSWSTGSRSTTKHLRNGSISGVIDGTINPRDNFGPVTVPDGPIS